MTIQTLHSSHVVQYLHKKGQVSVNSCMIKVNVAAANLVMPNPIWMLYDGLAGSSRVNMNTVLPAF